MPYLFAHFREKITIDGEQIYLGVSKNGYDWESLNDGKPIVTCTKGELGCRDLEIVKLNAGGYVIVATDLCLANRLDENLNIDWRDINHNGSKHLSLWRSDDLMSFSEQELIYLDSKDFGCMWAPEVFYDELNDEYVLHFSATHKDEDFELMRIYYSRTKDFKSFTAPKVFFEKDSSVFDSHITKIGDTYHFFYKTTVEPVMNMHATSKSLYGEYEHDYDFQDIMAKLDKPGSHEATTTYILPDDKWCLMLDFFGCEREKMGYVPFVSPKPGDAHFVRNYDSFTFPYGFKHGGVVEISDDEYNKLKQKYNK